jgi:hypothetical protein
MELQKLFDEAGLALCCGRGEVGRDMRVGLLLLRPLYAVDGLTPGF